MYLIFDTETTGLPRNYNAPITDLDNWPRLVQLAWQTHDAQGRLIEAKNYIVKPEGFTIPYNSEKVHGISTEKALKEGLDLSFVLDEFADSLAKVRYVIGHNIEFDLNIMGAEFLRGGRENVLAKPMSICTKEESTDYCQIPGGRGGRFKWPQLAELHHKLFSEGFDEAHNAAADVEATARCFLELLRLNVITAGRLKADPALLEEFRKHNPAVIKAAGVSVDVQVATGAKQEGVSIEDFKTDKKSTAKLDGAFSHLHCHSQYSVLQSTANVKAIMAKAKADGMPAVALTDAGNMFGAFSFVKAAKDNGIKPILGCELNVCRDHKSKDNKDNGYLQVLLAKNMTGYKNLSKLSSIGYLDGFYYVPRVDRDLVQQYAEGLIATTGGIKSEVPDLILNVGEQQAEEAFQWWHQLFGEDFYIQLMRHGLEEENRVNEVLLQFAKKYGVKVFAANNTFYLDKKDADAHDILLCIRDGKQQSIPIGKGRDFRFGFPNDEFYFKTQEEMKSLFTDLPEAIENISEIVDKIEEYQLDREPIMPDFPLPDGFTDADDYLRHLTYEGAKKRYPDLTDEVRERIDFELSVIKGMGYPGYFLIVQDFLHEARRMGVWVGPGRGSAAGSVVAYCNCITDVDPIAFNLLFERFLNPDRVSLPDIDIDFDEDGREKVMKWVVNKYGSDKVAQIITFGKMAPKMAIRDVARVKELPLNEANRLAKLVPDSPGTSFEKAYADVPELLKEKEQGDELIQLTLRSAEILEGSIRNTGTHACGVIIGRDALTEHIPISIARDSDLPVTQYDGSEVESVGMLKMDFLGLKTLAIIKDTVENIKKSKGIDLDVDNVPYDDEKTYELFSKGETTGIFQFESDGMKKNLRALKPNRFEDLIAMNALYRPGPMEYIPDFIKRKHGQAKIEYDIPEMSKYLEETYGITVYQEQVMLLSQQLAGFTKGEADTLRKAMGKKKKEILDQLKPKFLEGCKNNGHDVKIVDKIWNDWEAFAKYAFNKSHSTCYAYVAYRMAYLKAHYPGEFMSAVLSRNLNDIKKVSFFMDECRAMGIPVLGPDVNESEYKFTVNAKGEVRFGLGGIKGVGEGAVAAIVDERKGQGLYKSIFDLASRIDLRAANKRTLESLAYAGAFDSFEGTHRAQYFYEDPKEKGTFLERAVKYGLNLQEMKNSSQQSLFGGAADVQLAEPTMPVCAKWAPLEALAKEKEVIGIYISGHPLDEYKLEIKNYCRGNLSHLRELERVQGKDMSLAGVVTSAEHRTTKNGKPFGKFVLEDYHDTYEFALFGKDYVDFNKFMTEGWFLYIVGKVTKKQWGDDEWEFKINTIDLLSEVRQKLTKGIKLKVGINSVSEELITELETLVVKHPGKDLLTLSLLDFDEKYRVDLSSTRYKIDLNNDVINYLDKHALIEYDLN